MRVLLFLLFTLPLGAQVSYEQIVNADKTPENWLTYSGNYLSQRYSLLDQLTPSNAGDLEVKWVYQAPSTDKYQATPLVKDGVMYVSAGPNDVLALDAKTGRIFWKYEHDLPARVNPCCGRVNRGVALLDDMVYLAALDCRIIALDRLTGEKEWEQQVCNPSFGYALAHAPLAVKDKIIVGSAGGEFGIKGWLAAYDAKTGKQAWKFNNIPDPGEPGHETWENDAWKTGGGSIWLTGSYDPDLNLTYWGVGNPSPDWNPDVRPGDNLYTDSAIALDVDTGELKWHFQFTPHDEWDWDAVQIPVLADLEWKGKMRKLMLWANRNAFYYILDRETGEFLDAKQFVKQTWAEGIDKKGRPIRIPGMGPSEKGSLTFPGVQGGTNWYSPSFSLSTGLFYFAVWENYSSIYYKWEQQYEPGTRYLGGAPRSTVPATTRKEPDIRDVDTGKGVVRAMHPLTAEVVWEYETNEVSDSGMLTTASDLLFTGSREGHFQALNAKTGNLLYRKYLGGQIAASPMTYAIDGKQYVSIAAGHALFTFGLRAD